MLPEWRSPPACRWVSHMRAEESSTAHLKVDLRPRSTARACANGRAIAQPCARPRDVPNLPQLSALAPVAQWKSGGFLIAPSANRKTKPSRALPRQLGSIRDSPLDTVRHGMVLGRRLAWATDGRRDERRSLYSPLAKRPGWTTQGSGEGLPEQLITLTALLGSGAGHDAAQWLLRGVGSLQNTAPHLSLPGSTRRLDE